MDQVFASGWTNYSILVLSSLLALVVSLALGAILWFRSRRTPAPGATGAQDPLRPDFIQTRFHLLLNTGTLLLLLGLLLLPCVQGVGGSPGRALGVILSICGLLALSLLYAVRKKDLLWLESHHPDEQRERDEKEDLDSRARVGGSTGG